jgi:hypothetical protein
MTRREREILAWLKSASVRIYSTEERQAAQIDRPQTDAEWKHACRAMAAAGLCERMDYRAPVEPRTAEETEALLVKLAKRAARSDFMRGDPWGGL